jgi:hypothetical protein
MDVEGNHKIEKFIGTVCKIVSDVCIFICSAVTNGNGFIPNKFMLEQAKTRRWSKPTRGQGKVSWFWKAFEKQSQFTNAVVDYSIEENQPISVVERPAFCTAKVKLERKKTLKF